MPLLRCQRCDLAYEVPAAVAVRLPTSLARCSCGELIGLREVLAARFASAGDLAELDLSEYAVPTPLIASEEPAAEKDETEATVPRSVRVIARGQEGSIDALFTVGEYPLVIGRSGAHIELGDAELSIRHCEIAVRGASLILRDCDSHTGTFLDGEPVTEALLGEGMHLVRAGSALICVEPTDEPGEPVQPIELPSESLQQASPALMRKLLESGARKMRQGVRQRMLVGIEGPAQGREYEIPDRGLIVGREGDVRVPDEFLSRKHFSLVIDEQGWVRIKDLESRNGTFLNTLPARNTRIHPGDQIRAGQSVFRVEEREAEASQKSEGRRQK
ncbi:MAG: FHA domain-containing protein [Acidobacteria bacterium]|nr:FHA domain-containing protein [Acidobacteriota bacterium]